MRVSVIVWLAGTFGGGCVSSGRYRELENQYDAAVAERDAAEAGRDAATDALRENTERQHQHALQFARLPAALRGIEGQGLVRARDTDGWTVLVLDADLAFVSGSAALSSDGLASVRALAPALAAIPDARFCVEGHTDSTPVGNPREFPSLWHLGADRAITVVSEMIAAGFPPDRISAATSGDTRPVGAADGAAAASANRRIEIAWVPEPSAWLPAEVAPTR